MTITDKKKRGEWAELRFMAKASEHGFNLTKPWGDSLPYDLAIDLDGRLIRVQVKSTLYRRRGWVTNMFVFCVVIFFEALGLTCNPNSTFSPFISSQETSGISSLPRSPSRGPPSSSAPTTNAIVTIATAKPGTCCANQTPLPQKNRAASPFMPCKRRSKTTRHFRSCHCER